MRFYLKSFFNVFVISAFMCFGISFADEANTRYTDFSFAGGLNEKTIYLSGGETQTVSFYLTNNSDSIINGNFNVVDATGLAAGLNVCMANGQNEVFGKYGTFQQTGFSIGGGQTFSGSVDMKFPEGYSGEYLGCITYTPSVSEDVGSVNPQPRKALFLKSVLNATASLYYLKVFPGSRSKSSLANVGEIRFYDVNNELVYFSGNIVTDSGGNAEFSALIHDGIYTVVYKGQSHLASYLYNIPVIAGSTLGFDFTTGNSLSGVQNFTNTIDDGSRYQIAGDLKNINGKYDFTVNGNDIAIITKSGFVDPVDDLDPRDLNGDNVVNVSDLAIIGANFEQQDVFFGGHAYNLLR